VLRAVGGEARGDAVSIDPAKLEQQQRATLKIVPPCGETKCDRCGKRTRDASGTCAPCRRSMPDLKRLTAEQLGSLADLCRAELKRRRDEIDAAMEGA
jgi:hypothetical protein